MEGLSFMALVMACAPLVDPGTARALVDVESAFNPNAIGVVGGALERQPRSKAQALATTRTLHEHGWNFSIGLAQINVRNLRRLNLTIDAAFDPCSNLVAMQSILEDCFERASHNEKNPQRSLRKALSCYYSGNFVTGFREGYVNRVVKAAKLPARLQSSTFHQPKESS